MGVEGAVLPPAAVPPGVRVVPHPRGGGAALIGSGTSQGMLRPPLEGRGGVALALGAAPPRVGATGLLVGGHAPALMSAPGASSPRARGGGCMRVPGSAGGRGALPSVARRLFSLRGAPQGAATHRASRFGLAEDLRSSVGRPQKTRLIAAALSASAPGTGWPCGTG